MKRIMYLFAVIVSGALVLSGCQSTTASGITGSSRSQFLLISSEDVNTGAALAYKQEINKARSAKALDTNASYTKRVNAISKRLIEQVGVFRPDAKNWNWEMHVITSKSINAYCMPGGKIAVYTGIISTLNLTDDELAAVIGHEIAHALREHSREQISQQIAKDQVLLIGGSLLGMGSTTQNLANIASKYAFSLPFSRTMETESDIIGMELMARAGFNPEAAINVWRKMNALGNEAPPEFISTHPSDKTRIANLEKELPKVMPLYEEAKAKGAKSN
ncbi:MAG: M48 family metallopeptidase [Betaproteobacteria bacterium]|nr:M48 family metallopeptidase [Betaproteobacteria bacterium]